MGGSVRGLYFVVVGLTLGALHGLAQEREPQAVAPVEGEHQGVALLKMPYVDEPTIRVHKGEVRAQVYKPNNPLVHTLYYLPQLVQRTPELRSRDLYLKSRNRRDGKVSYSFWLGIPQGFDGGRERHFRENRKNYETNKEKYKSSANVYAPGFHLVGVSPPIMELGQATRAGYSLFLVELFVDSAREEDIGEALEKSFLSLEYEILLPASAASKSYKVGTTCRKVRETFGLSELGKMLSMLDVKIGVERLTSEVGYVGEWRNLTEASAKDVFVNQLVKACGLESKETGNEKPAQSGQVKPGEEKWFITFSGGYEEKLDHRFAVDVRLRDYLFPQRGSIRLTGDRPNSREEPVRAFMEEWQAISEVRGGRRYRISARGHWRPGQAYLEMDSCGWKGKLPPEIANLEFKSAAKPFSLMMRFTPNDGTLPRYLEVCDSFVSFLDPRDGRLEGMMNDVQGEYGDNDGEIRVRVAPI